MITVNAMGDACPIPVIKTKKALQELSGSGEIEVLVDNETAVRNVTKMAENSGASVTQEKLGEGRYRVIVRVGDGSTDPGGDAGGRRGLRMRRPDRCVWKHNCSHIFGQDGGRQ